MFISLTFGHPLSGSKSCKMRGVSGGCGALGTAPCISGTCPKTNFRMESATSQGKLFHTATSKKDIAIRILVTDQSFELQISEIENRMYKNILVLGVPSLLSHRCTRLSNDSDPARDFFLLVLGSLYVMFIRFSNVSVCRKPKTLEKPIKIITTMIFKLSPGVGVQCFRLCVYRFIGFFQCFGLLVRHF